jgi:Domain of unknown function (DUF4388)
MWTQREVVDKLVTIIQSLQSQRETGQLTVTYGDGIVAEEGIVVFSNGKVVEARIGRRTGSDALNRLSSLEHCSCYFARSAEKPRGPGPYTPTPNGTLETLTNESTHMLPSTPNTSSQPRLYLLEENTDKKRVDVPHVSAVPHAIVQHDVAFHKIEQRGLSRSHRRLFLLIDGQRSVSDLTRLMGKKEKEVSALLHDLERAAIIYIYLSP